MIVTLHFKTPDVVDTVEEQVRDVDVAREIILELEKWISYRENVTLLYDTEKKTLVVREKR